MGNKKTEPPKPLYPLKQQWQASLEHFIHEAGMLADMAQVLAKEPDLVSNKIVRQQLQERLDAFHKARFGEDEP